MRRAFRAHRRPVTLVITVVAAALLVALSGCGANIKPVTTASAPGKLTFKDEVGRTITLAGPAKTAIVIGSYDVDDVVAVGAGKAIIGTDDDSYSIAQGSGRASQLGWNSGDVIAQNSTSGDVNYEQIIAKKPDVVIMYDNADWQNTAQHVESLGIQVVVVSGWDYTKFTQDITILGEVFGDEAGAQKVLDFKNQIQGVVNEHLDSVANKDQSVYYEEDGAVFQTPTKGSGFFEALQAAGGKNLFADIIWGTPGHTTGSVWKTPIDPVQLVQRNPDVVIHDFGGTFPAVTSATFQSEGKALLGRAGWTTINAYKNDRIYVLNPFVTNQLGKEFLTLYAAVWLYPSAFQGFSPDQYAKEYVEDFLHLKFLGGQGVYYESFGQDRA